jgi:hypothetical protein
LIKGANCSNLKTNEHRYKVSFENDPYEENIRSHLEILKRTHLSLNVVEDLASGAVPAALVPESIDTLLQTFLDRVAVCEEEYCQDHLHDDDHQKEDRVLHRNR